MGWTASRKPEPGLDGLVVVPTPAARIQDLGAFRSGQLMETDLLEGSALICAAGQDGEMRIGASGEVDFTFEGNAIGAMNLERFHERCLSAAGRLVHASPSIAYGSAAPDDLTPVARFDLSRMVFTEILDDALLEGWSGEPIPGFLPPPLDLPCLDKDLIAPILKLPMRHVICRPEAAMVWQLLDGTLIVKTPDQDICLVSRDDPALWDLTDRLDLDAEAHGQIYGGTRRPGSPR